MTDKAAIPCECDADDDLHNRLHSNATVDVEMEEGNGYEDMGKDKQIRDIETEDASINFWNGCHKSHSNHSEQLTQQPRQFKIGFACKKTHPVKQRGKRVT